VNEHLKHDEWRHALPLSMAGISLANNNKKAEQAGMRGFRAIAIGVLITCAAQAQAEFSGTVMMATDYVFRGISNTDGDPAIQGSFDYGHDSGFYAGIWASNVKFRENADVDAIETVQEASVEIDYYAGLASELDNGLSWEFGAQLVTYPGAEEALNYDYWEALLALGYSFDQLALEPELIGQAYFSPDYFGNGGDATYLSGLVYLHLPADFGLNLSIGRQTFEEDASLDYTDTKIGITKALAGFEFELAYTDTNIPKEDCDGLDICSGRVVLSIARPM